MNLSIVLLDGEKLNFNIKKDSCVIGRSPQCDVVIQHEAMSRKHCLLEVKQGEIFVTDLGSSNGVSIEGQRIPVNTPTPYQTYFSLSFGAVQSISIGLEEAKEDRPSSAGSSSKKDLSSPAIKVKRTEGARTILDKTNPKGVPAAGKPNSTVLIKVAAFVAILGILGYFMTKEDESAPATPEQIYE